MAEAVFTISADIEPTLNPRVLERQGQEIARQLSGTFKKEIQPIDLKVAAGNAFSKVITTAKNSLNTLSKTAAKVPSIISNVGKVGRNAFSGFLEAIQVTRKDMVGFGDTIIDTIRNTGRFRDAISGIKDAGGAITDLPQRFENVAAQIQSGTSVIDRFAAGGDKLAQFFQPLAREAEATRSETVDLGNGLDRLIVTMTKLAQQLTKTGNGLAGEVNDFNLLGTSINKIEKPFKDVEEILKKTGLENSKFGKELRETFAGAAGDPEKLVQALILLRDQAQKTAGPFGLLNRVLGEVSKAERDTAQATRLELNKALIQLGQSSQVKGFQELAARISLVGDRVKNVSAGFQTFAGILAKLTGLDKPFNDIAEAARNAGNAIGNSVGKALDDLKRKFVTSDFTKSFIQGMSNLESSVRRLAAPITNLGTKGIDTVNRALGRLQVEAGLTGTSIQKLLVDKGIAGLQKFGQSVNDNLVTPIVQGVQLASAPLREFGGSVIQRFSESFRAATGGASFAGVGTALVAVLSSSLSSATGALRNLASEALTGLRDGFAGAAGAIREIGTTIVSGLNTGITAAASKVSAIAAPIIESIGNALRSASSSLGSAVGAPVVDAIGNGVSAASGPLANLGSRIIELIGGGISSASGALAGLGSSVIQGLSNGIQAASGALRGLGSSVLQGLSDGIKGTASAMAQIGTEIVNGLKAGILGAASGLGTVLGTIKRVLVDGTKKLLGIASPSTVFIAIGKFIIQGLATGIKTAASIPLKAIEEVAKGLINTVKGAANLAQQGFQSLINVGKAAGLALAGLGATAVVTGSQFNILQQVVNATLPSILGSAEASKALLVQVNALNDTSPFARSAFLELTRVLAGFGVEAAQITPTIDAIQQAVAATGGGEQDLLELGNAFAKIASTGRLTGDILQSFTVRGIDAIQLLAAETGKTASVIRDEMSSGLLDATTTINTLSKAISTRFAGATDAVAKNFPGALDRVKARLRDFGAALTKAFINPEGGGALVDLFNAVATAISAVTKIITPIFLPAIQAVANVMTNASTAIENFVKPLLSAQKGFESLGFAAGGVTDKIRPFVESLGPLIPILAGIVGFFPAFLSFIPVVGPLLAGIGGGGGAALAVFTALVARSKELQDALKGLVSGFQEAFAAFSPPDADPLGGILDSIKAVESTLAGGLASFIEPLGAAFGQLAAQVGPVVIDLLPKLASLLATLGSTLGPLLASVIQQISPVVAFLVQKFGELLPSVEAALKGLKTGLDPIIEALGRLLVALQPAADLVKGVLVVAFEALAVVLPPIGEAIAYIIDVITDGITAINPAIQTLADAFNGFKDNILEIGDSFEGLINGIIKGTNIAIRGLNLLKPGKDIKQFDEVTFTFSRAERAAEATKKQVDAVGFAIKTQVPTVKQLETSYKNAFDAASKAAADAQKKVSALTDTLNQQLGEVGKKISPVFDAQSAVQASNQALADARANAQKAAGQIGLLEKERAKALRDALTPVQEMAAAERELTRTRRGLEKINRDMLETEQALRDLRNEELLGEKRAALDRAIERAKISLNKATRDQINLDKEANKVAIPSVNLAGLNLDQIRAKLANVRASLSAQKAAQALTEKDAKTQQEIDDEKKSAALDVADAAQSLKDAERARIQFDLDNTKAIRDTELQLEELRFSKEDQLLKEQEDLNKINDLRAGETMQQKIIKDFEEKIKKARDDSAQAQKAVTAAVQKTKEAEAQLALVTAQLKNDTEGVANAQLRIWQLKNSGLALDKQTQEAINGQLESVRAIMRELAGAKTEAAAAEKRKLEAEEALKKFNIDQAIKGVNEELDRAAAFERDRGDFGDPKNRDALLSGFTKLAAFLKTASDAGAIQTVVGGSVTDAQKILAQPAFLESLAKRVLESPDGDLHKILKELLAKAGLVIPGFATGYAPGEAVHRGMNDGKGLVRMFEFGKEAVLPLTRATDMKRVVQNPQVLPSILQALPKLSLAAANGDPQAIETLASMVRPTSGGTVSGSAFQSRQAKKQDNEQMAASIASAVKVAVKEALAESDGLGNDIDINVTPATDHNVAIANEVRRQVKKYFEGRR